MGEPYDNESIDSMSADELRKHLKEEILHSHRRVSHQVAHVCHTVLLCAGGDSATVITIISNVLGSLILHLEPTLKPGHTNEEVLEDIFESAKAVIEVTKEQLAEHNQTVAKEAH